MAEMYVGYGFKTDDIPVEEKLAFLLKYGTDEEKAYLFDSYKSDITVSEGMKLESICDENIRKDLVHDIECRVDGEYIAKVINRSEIAAGRMKREDLVEECDGFVFFGSLRFPMDEERCQIVKNADDFIAIITDYFPASSIYFANIYGGSEFTCDDLYME